jgi:hypothetical protein
MLGRRIDCPYATDGGLLGEWPQAGDYFLYAGHGWRGVTPDGREADLSKHDVVEHEDGTITVSPSILVGGGGQPGSWHGYLERGVWRSC